MTREQKTQLATALRSGAFIQTKGSIGRIDEDGKLTVCVLGVVCEVFGLRYRPARYPEEYSDLLDDRGVGIGYDFSRVGLTQDQVSALWEANDDGATFEQLADYVENEL